ncbi:hypothetical protein [Mesorhizobium sp. M0496]|uniref:hypothetical protein n=1 Tax=Mesorhizobium sp. M0496 TaxID=2956952 RepID=UPI00333B64CD
MLQITPQLRKSIRISKALDVYRTRQHKADNEKSRTAKLRKLSDRRFSELVDDVARIMKQGDTTPFSFEGACRHGVRSSLCLDGWPWLDADICAAEVIAAALNKIGAMRPTWWQGQPEYADTDTSRGFCAHRRCGRPIPTDRGIRNGKPVKYCCDECGSTAAEEMRRREGRRVSMAEWLALCAARSSEKERQRSRNCDQCGEFMLTRDPKDRYCSRGCFHIAQRKYEQRTCENAACGMMFTPKNSGRGKVTRYCSKACAAACRIQARPALSCLTCGTIFYPDFPSDKRRYCSPAHNPYASKAARAATFVDAPPLAPTEIEPIVSPFRCDKA